MKTILAATDFSTASINAVFYAADLAASIHARLILFHAIPFPIAISEISVSGDFIDDMTEAGDVEMEDLYKKVRQRTKDAITVSKIIKIGSVEQEIENISFSEKPLAIVLGIRSGKTFERALVGSSVFHIMNHVGVPSLIIPENCSFAGFKQIGMACDLKKIDEKLPFNRITEWLTLFNARLDIINISERASDFKSDQMEESLTLQAQFNLFRPRFHFLTGKHISDAINEFINQHPLDLLMVFPRKYNVSNCFIGRNQSR